MRLYRHLCILLSFSGASAAVALPTAQLRRDTSTFIHPAQLALFKLYSDYASAAYCKVNNNSTGDKILCGKGDRSCSLVESAETVTLLEFQNCRSGDTTGYVGLDHTNRNIILAFRGSRSWRNSFWNIRAWLTKWEIVCPGCRVHSGWKDSWTKCLRQQIESELVTAANRYPGYDIFIAGHSLGGAMATIAVADLRDYGRLSKAILFTLGAPRVGNKQFTSYVEGTGLNYRFTHREDPVPHMPSKWPFPYADLYPEYHIRTDSLGSEVKVSDVVMCEEGCKGRDGAWGLSQTIDHYWYFGKVNKCMSKTNLADTRRRRKGR